MSVVKSKRGKPKLGVLTKAQELAVYTIHICSNERMRKLVDEGLLTKEHVDECYTSWKAHAAQGNTHNLILSMNRFYENLWKGGKLYV